MEEIIENLLNWQKKKNDKSFMFKILFKANYFKIKYPIKDDNSESYHFYAALEKVNKHDKKEEYKFIMYVISKNRDTKEYLEKNNNERNNNEKIIEKLDVINILHGQDHTTEITEVEAKKRINRWCKDIKEWLDENEVFDVFDIPKSDFDFKNKKISMEGHFGIKDIINNQNESKVGFSPDIVIYQTDSESFEQTFYDMAKLSPPYRNEKYKDECSLLNHKL